MTADYVTSEEHLPDNLKGEITLQVTDTESKEIFVTQARIARDANELTAPQSLTIVRGPHENIEEEWYIEIIKTDIDRNDVDRDLLWKCMERSQTESNVINARSDELRALLMYLVETDQYKSVSEAVRSILRDYLSENFPDLVETYVDLQTEIERENLTTQFKGSTTDDRR